MTLKHLSNMAEKMAAALFRWRGRLLLAISAPVIGLPLLSTVKAGSMHVHPRELDIYSEPEILQYPKEEEESSLIEEKVSIARRSVWGWAKNAKEGLAKVRNTWSAFESKTLEFAKLIRTDQTFQIKVGGITAGILGGALLAGRGRRPIRRTFFSFALGSSAAAICYPRQAVDMSLASYDRLKEFVKQQKIWFNQEKTPVISDQPPTPSETRDVENTSQLSSTPVSPSIEREFPEESVESEEQVVAAQGEAQSSLWSKMPFLHKLTGGILKTSKDVVTQANNGGNSVDVTKDEVVIQEDTQNHGKIEGDTGQSNPEDKDMYSTRS